VLAAVPSTIPRSSRHALDVLAQVARLDGAVAGYLRTPAAPVTLLAGSSALHRLVPRALTSFLREAASAPVQLCALQEHWSRRQLALCFGAAVPQSATAVLAIAEHIRRAAFSTDRLTTLERPF
jgi:hypothetical protein